VGQTRSFRSTGRSLQHNNIISRRYSKVGEFIRIFRDDFNPLHVSGATESNLQNGGKRTKRFFALKVSRHEYTPFLMTKNTRNVTTLGDIDVYFSVIYYQI